MSDSGTTEAERRSQPGFRIGQFAAGLLLLISIGLFDHALGFVPNRHELGRRTVTLQFVPVDFTKHHWGPLEVAGAWAVRSTDLRIGGISALAIDQGRLLALSDSGVLIRFAAPKGSAGAAEVRELPTGPSSGAFKRDRDSEGLVRDPGGRGWWVAFEYWHELWLYDQNFGRALDRIKLGPDRWRPNKGVEGLAAQGRDLLMFPEDGGSVLRLSGPAAHAFPILGGVGRISDAVAVGSGRVIAVERRLTMFGFRNALVLLGASPGGYRLERRIPLPLGPIDNVEAIAVAPPADGRSRLWLMTDDDFQRPLRTLLIAIDMAD